MEQLNAEIIILSPTSLDTCFLPNEHDGRFWLYRMDGDVKKRVAELWGKDDGWYLLKNAMYCFPSDFKDCCLLTPEFQLNLSSEEGNFCLLYHSLPTQSALHYELRKENQYQIGRDQENDICIQDPMVSSYHAVLTYTGNQWQIGDVNSRNGTYVNARAIDVERLNPGDRIQIMQYLFVMGKDTLLIVPESQLKLKLIKVQPEVRTGTPFVRKTILASVYPRIHLPPCTLEIEMPLHQVETKKTPFLLSAGPSFTMGLSSLSMGMLSIYQANTQKQSLQSILPTVMMSLSMALSMLLWPIILHLYEQHQFKKESKKMELNYLSYLEEVKQKACRYMEQESKSRQTLYEDCDTAMYMLEHSPWLLHERMPHDEEFLMVSMGKGEVLASIELKSAKSPLFPPVDPSWSAYHSLMSQSFTLHDQNICIDMKQHRRIGVYGNQERTTAFLMDKLLQIFLLHHRFSQRICILIKASFCCRYGIQTLPALFYEGHRFLVCEQEDGKEVDFALRDWWKEKGEDDYLTIFSFDRGLEERLPCLDMLLNEDHVLYLQAATSIRQLRPECDKILSLQEKHQIKLDEMQLLPSYISEGRFREAMLHYHAYVFEGKQKTGFPSQCTFLDMFQCGNVAQLRILQRWNEAKTSLEAYVGMNEFEEIITLDLHERYHGPHGLVAGMTGSGKSEWLMTLILSLAVQYSPKDISFVLIDYKGGGMSQAFAQLPHIAGILTNLDHEQMTRSIQGIRQELTRRQQLFRQSQESTKKNVMHIDQYRQLYMEGQVKEQLSHILIITDEFAELKQQQPAFMEDLKQISRIGRSLGIHLLLATQKPSGVVDDQIWSNARFHVCLKVQDRMDSMEMLKKEDAIHLKTAGMFYLQIGYNESYVKGMGAWANAPYEEKECYEKKTNSELTVISTTGNPLYEKDLSTSSTCAMTQLEAIVCYISKIAAMHQLHARALWLPVLKDHIEHQELMDDFHDSSAIGVIDDPEKQRRLPLHFSLRMLSHIAIIASREEDKKMMLQAMLSVIDQEHTYVYLLDQSIGQTMEGYDDEILYHEDEKWDSYLYILQKELQERKNKKKNYDIFSVFQHFEVFLTAQDDRKEALLQLAREGKEYGMYFCFVLQDPYALTYQIKAVIHTIYCFYMEEQESSLALFHATSSIKAGKQIGRGILEKEQNLYQFQCADIKPISNRKRPKARIPMLPNQINLKQKEGHVYLGMDIISKEEVWIADTKPLLVLCAYEFYEPFQAAMQEQKVKLYSMKELNLHLQEDQIQKALYQGAVLWNGSGFSQACYSLNLPYRSDQGINERMGVLWENQSYRIVQLVEETENG